MILMVLLNCGLCKTQFGKMMLNPSDSSSCNSDVHRLEVSDLECVRGDITLYRGLSFSTSGNRCLHIVGPNGCGKTSLLRQVCGLMQYDQGQIKWNKEFTPSHTEYKQSLAYVGHKDGLKNELTAFENLQFYQRLNSGNDEEEIDNCLARLQILKCADLAAQSLSFGQRRRLAFARLLIADKPLWVLDEPFTGIDVDGRTLIETLCIEHLQNNGLILMTHHQSLANSPLSQWRDELNLEEIGKNQ